MHFGAVEVVCCLYSCKIISDTYFWIAEASLPVQQFSSCTFQQNNKQKQKVVILEMERAGDSDRDRDGIWECC